MVTARFRHLRIASKIDIMTIIVDDYDNQGYENDYESMLYRNRIIVDDYDTIRENRKS